VSGLVRKAEALNAERAAGFMAALSVFYFLG